jgi:prenyltransferase beta subunit
LLAKTAAMAITSTLYSSDDKAAKEPLLFDTGMLERYILLCAQDIHGGLRDKPSKSRDFYHSCYNLSGLSIGQENEGRVAKTHPCFNIRVERAQEILAMSWPEGGAN